MKRLALIGLLALVASVAWPTEITEESPGGWQPSDQQPEVLKLLVETIKTNGPQVAEFEFVPYRAEGRLEGCAYHFIVSMLDWAYRSNQPILVFGSIGYFHYANRLPFLGLRIGLVDLEERENQVWKKNASVNYAYLRFGDKSLAGEEDVTTEGEDGVKVFAYTDSEDPEESLMAWLAVPETLAVWFNRRPKSADLHFELSVIDFEEAWMSLGGCYRELAGFEE